MFKLADAACLCHLFPGEVVGYDEFFCLAFAELCSFEFIRCKQGILAQS